jgi:hypothetical protein
MTPERRKCAVRKAQQRRLFARKRLAETRFRGNEYACINQRVTRRLTHVSWQQRLTEETTVLYSVCMKLVQSETRHSEAEFERLSKADVEDFRVVKYL